MSEKVNKYVQIHNSAKALRGEWLVFGRSDRETFDLERRQKALKRTLDNVKATVVASFIFMRSATKRSEVDRLVRTRRDTAQG